MSRSTPATQEASREVALPDNSSVDGLEDIDPSDLTIPRLTIVGKEAVFRHNQTNESYEEIRVIMLGLVKQRVLWPPTPEEGEGPLCRSVDFERGIPDPARWNEKFNGVKPVTVSGFSLAEVTAASEDVDDALPWASCGLKEWKTNPASGKTPWCSEQFVVPALLLDENDRTSPILLTFQRTGLKAARTYIGSFSQRKSPLYSAVTEISLVAQKKGQVDYATPEFTRIAETDPSDFQDYSVTLAGIREFLRTPRIRRDEEDEETPAPPKQQKPKAPKPPPVEEDDDDDDEDVIEASVVEDEASQEAPPAKRPSPPVEDDDDDDDDDEEPF